MRAPARQAGMLVEFLGAAGVGKTSLCIGIERRLLQSGIAAARTDSLKIARLRPRSWLETARAAHASLRMRPCSLAACRYAVRKLAVHAIRQRYMLESADIYLCDEGMFQKIRAFYRASRGLSMQQIAEEVFSYAGVPDVVVIVEASAEAIFSRRCRRGRAGEVFDLDSVRQDVLLMEDSVSTVLHVQRHLRPDLKVFRVNLEHVPEGAPPNATADGLRELWLNDAARTLSTPVAANAR